MLEESRGLILDRLKPARSRRAPSDLFMLRFHDYLKRNAAFQTRAPRRLWAFPPGSVWLAMTDGCSHAVLRGRYALEHSYFVAPGSLVAMMPLVKAFHRRMPTAVAGSPESSAIQTCRLVPEPVISKPLRLTWA